MSNVRLSRQHANTLAGFSAAVILALAGGCGGENESLKQIEKAEQSVSALTADGTFASLADTYRKAELGKIHDSMNALAGSGPESVRAAAFSIASRAKAGIASLDSKAALEADRQLGHRLDELRVGLNTYTLQKSIAEANSGVGTQDLIKTLQGSLETNKKAAAEASKSASKVQAAVDELSTRMKSVSSQAAAKRAQASSIAASMQGVSATEGLEILKRSTAVKAEADVLEQQAADIGTQLGLAQAELGRARSTATALDEQSKQLQREIAGGQTKLEEERKLNAAAGKAADEASADIAKKFADLTAFRTGTLDPAHQAAVTSTQKAVELAKQATAKAGGNAQSVAAGNTGKLSAASMQQNYADALVSQARSQDVLAGTLGLMAGSKPALPNAAEIASAAEAARKSSDDTLTQAREIYGQIKESLDGISDEKLKTRIAETSRLLESLSSKQGVTPVEPAAAPAPAAAAPGGTEPSASAAASPAALADIRKKMDAYHDKMRGGDWMGTIELFDFTSDTERTTLTSVINFAQAALAFDTACQEKFNQSGAEFLGPLGPMITGLKAQLEGDKDRTSADYNIVIAADGKTAEATAKNPRPTEKPNHLRFKDGAWWLALDADEMPPQAVAGIAMITPMLKSLAADVKAGKFESAEQLKTAISAQMGSMGRPGAQPPAGGPGEDDPNK